jgi:hypothetical protein
LEPPPESSRIFGMRVASVSYPTVTRPQRFTRFRALQQRNPEHPRDRSHSQLRHRQDEPPGPITAQGCDREAAGAKTCRKRCTRTWRSKRPRLNIFAQHKRLMVTFRTPQPPEDIPIYNGRGCTLLELSQGKYRWPISYPVAEDFCFCGNEPVKGLPYCPGYARIAYRSVGRQGGCVSTSAAAPPRYAIHSRGFIQSFHPRQRQCLRYCETERFRGLRLTIEFHGLLTGKSPPSVKKSVAAQL